MNLDARFKMYEEREALRLLDKLWSWDLKKLPDANDPDYIEVRDNMMMRTWYIRRFGFALVSKQFSDSITQVFNENKIGNFVELMAGTGFITKILLNQGFQGKAITLEIPDDKDHKGIHWGLKKTPVYKQLVDSGDMILGDITEMEPMESDCVVVSWIPQGAGYVVKDWCEKTSCEYLVVIGEGYGGCTADDDFHDYLENEFKVQKRIYIDSFACIHDDCILYKRK